LVNAKEHIGGGGRYNALSVTFPTQISASPAGGVTCSYKRGPEDRVPAV